MLVAVTKTIDPVRINQAIEAGITDIGENRIQEYLSKKDSLAPHRFHCVGHLQTNKVKYIARDVFLIHSVDSVRLMEALDEAGASHGRTIPILLEVNTSREASKYGVDPDAALRMLEAAVSFTHIKLAGLMTVAAFAQDEKTVRPCFVLLRELKERAEIALGSPLQHLSMGMSNDYENAIEEGATIVRIGTALFGSRT